MSDVSLPARPSHTPHCTDLPTLQKGVLANAADAVGDTMKSMSETAQKAVGAGQQEQGKAQRKNDSSITGKMEGLGDEIAGGTKKNVHDAKSEGYSSSATNGMSSSSPYSSDSDLTIVTANPFTDKKA